MVRSTLAIVLAAPIAFAAAYACSSGGGPAGGATALAACRAYVEARCLKQDQCGLEPFAQCIGLESLCPDLLFAKGSTATPDSVAACAASIAGLTCFQATFGPRCLPAGTLPGGAACAFNAQCASYACSGQDKQCGICAALAQPGGSCGTDNIECPEGQRCDGTSRVCVSNDPEAGTGLPCTGACAGILSCITSSPNADAGTCQPDPSPGQPCVYYVGLPGLSCGQGFNAAWCRFSGADQDSGVCQAPAEAGGPCGPRPQQPYNVAVCDQALDCRQVNGGRACQSHGEAGAPCGLLGGDLVGCDPMSTCSASPPDAGTCLAVPTPPAVGDPCVGDAGCGRLACVQGSCAMGIEPSCL